MTAFAAELCAAARRGVRVCVLADGFGSFETRRRFWAKLREHGVEARLFHPIGFPPRWLSFRDHRKILVADRAVAFTGGMNIGEEYGSSTPSAGAETTAWRDTHARVEGPAAWEMALVFEEGWRRAGGTGLGLTPEEEDRLLGNLITHWAVRSTLDLAAICADQPWRIRRFPPSRGPQFAVAATGS